MKNKRRYCDSFWPTRIKMIKSIFTIFGLLSVVLLTGCASVALFAVNSVAHFNRRSELTKNISYGDKARHKLDVYVPRGLQKDRPVIIFLHGGGLTDGSKDQYYYLGKTLAAHGFVAVIPNYRLYPEVVFPKFVEDAALVVRWLHAHAKNFGASPEKIFVMGHSAGAYIAALLNFDERYLRALGGEKKWLRGTIGVAGVYESLPLAKEPYKKIFKHQGPDSLLLPTHYVDGHEPPVLLLHGRNDRVVTMGDSLLMARAIRKKGGRERLVIYQRANHTEIIGRISPLFRSRLSPVVEDVKRFVEEILDGDQP